MPIVFSLLNNYVGQNPTVLVHGIASNQNEMTELKNHLQNQFNLVVYTPEVGNGELTSIFAPMDRQCDLLAAEIKSYNESVVDLVGISQGGLLSRCYVERYTHLHDYPNVGLLMTMGTPHMGIFYPENAVNRLVVPGYWKDPFNYGKYLKNKGFLARLNGDTRDEMTAQYKANMVSLNRFVMIWSNIDNVINPIVSAKFEFYNITEAERTGRLVPEPLEESWGYKNDVLGLRTLNESGRLIIIEKNCEHNKFKTVGCLPHR